MVGPAGGQLAGNPGYRRLRQMSKTLVQSRVGFDVGWRTDLDAQAGPRERSEAYWRRVIQVERVRPFGIDPDRSPSAEELSSALLAIASKNAKEARR